VFGATGDVVDIAARASSDSKRQCHDFRSKWRSFAENLKRRLLPLKTLRAIVAQTRGR
jgi:hypothetical protein